MKEEIEMTFCHRVDGRIEAVCKHGIGHTIDAPKVYKKQRHWQRHGCDGCCTKEFVKQAKRLLNGKVIAKTEYGEIVAF